MNKLSKRLQTLCQMVDSGAKIADIGTDHGYVPIYLVENGRVQSAVAADKNKGPLSICADNIKNLGLQGLIKTVLSDGLSNVDTSVCDTLIIAGMGGMAIIDILKLSKDKLTKTLLLQPQKDMPNLRRYLHEIGYRIIDEVLVYDDMFYYSIVKAEIGEDIPYNDEDYQYGRILIAKKDDALKQKLLEDLKKINLILQKITPDKKKRIADLTNEVKTIKGLVKRLEG